VADQNVEIAIVGAGVAGIAAAYYLCVEQRKKSVLLIDSRQPMSYTRTITETGGRTGR